MTDTKHTPGPWTVSKVDEEPDEGFFGGATIDMSVDDDDEYLSGNIEITSNNPLADVHLIATAPEMLSEIEKELVWIRHIRKTVLLPESVDMGFGQAIKVFEKLIAKAKGLTDA